MKKASSHKFKILSLFSGAGGMDLGFEMIDKFQLLFANDILLSSAQTYSLNFHLDIIDMKKNSSFSLNGNPVYLVGDVSNLDFENLECEDVDLIIGGPPCQDFSVVRGPEKERQGIAVYRGRLYAHFIRALIRVQPKVFVFENVPGLLSANRGNAFRVILEDFSKLNFRWNEIKNIVGNNFNKNIRNYKVIFSGTVDSANFGVPQRRKRLLIIGIREDFFKSFKIDKTELVLYVRNTLEGKNSILSRYPLTPLEVFEGLPLPDLNDHYKLVMKEYSDIATHVKTEFAVNWRQKFYDNLSFNAVDDYLMLNNIIPHNKNELEKAFEEHWKILNELDYYGNKIEGKLFSDGSNKLPEESEEVLERLKMIPPGENYLFVKETKWKVEGRGMSLIYRRLHPLKPAYTVVAYGGGGTWGYHYERNRGKLTNRERARLQTFPDWFLFKGNTSEMRAQIGEAVPPLLGKKIAEIVDTILGFRR